MDNLKIVIDFSINDDLINLIQEASTCPYAGIGDGTGDFDFKQAKRLLEKVVATGKFAKHTRLGILKMYRDDVLVGFSFPRQVDLREYEKFKLSVLKDYYRTGTIYVGKAYRGQGIAKAVVQEFKQHYKHVLWTCRDCNVTSQATALSVGLRFSHHLYFDAQGEWSFHHPKKLKASNHVYS